MSEKTAHGLDATTLLDLTTKIVSAYAGNAKLSATELTEIIGSVSRTLAQISSTGLESEKKELIPAVPVKKSVTPDFVICLDDGKKLRMLKRHLMSTYGLTPDQYRTRWNLPKDYPMVAPNYARTRSELAKKIGLGRTSRKPAVADAAKKAPMRKRAASAA